MTADWSPLHAELSAWRAENRTLAFWWRDDDAIAATPALTRLTELAENLNVPAHLAVIPKHATSRLVSTCARHPLLIPLVHGWSHENHAPEGQKKAEFGHPRSDLKADAAKGLARMSELFGQAYLPCFVPPWNRMAPDLAVALPDLGYTCLSTFTPRAARLVVPGLVQINTHIDPIHWRGGGGLVDADVLLAQVTDMLKKRRHGLNDAAEPLGLLTHHLVHTEEIWSFVKALTLTLLDGGAIPVNLLDLKDNLP